MIGKTPQDGATAPTSTQEPKSSSRRRLLRAGVGASPAILTFVSAPVRATYTTTTASAFASANVSRPGGHGHVPVSGCKPSWWVSNMSPLPAYCKDAAGNALKFKHLFKGHPTYDNKTLKQCMQMSSDTGMDGVVKHICAAYLNAMSGKVPATICSAQTAKDIWSAYHSAAGCYEPTAGVKWYADTCHPGGVGGINPWLKSTMPIG